MPLQMTPFLSRRVLRWSGLSLLLLIVLTSFLLVTDNSSFALQSSGYEGDVTPRPNGKNAAPGLSDAVQIGRFATGLDIASHGTEWQRADTAPRSTLGDGVVGITDVVQSLRYAAGIDPLTAVGGPASPPNKSSIKQGIAQPEAARAIQLGTPVFTAESVTIPIELEAQGNENALSFSLAFDPALLINPVVVLGNDTDAQALLLLNTNELASGHYGVGLALPAGVVYSAGKKQILRVTFTITPAGFGKQTPVGFGDFPTPLEVADQAANTLPQPIFDGKRITLLYPTPAITALNPATVFAGDVAFTLGVDRKSVV